MNNPTEIQVLVELVGMVKWLLAGVGANITAMVTGLLWLIVRTVQHSQKLLNHDMEILSLRDTRHEHSQAITRLLAEADITMKYKSNNHTR